MYDSNNWRVRAREMKLNIRVRGNQGHSKFCPTKHHLAGAVSVRRRRFRLEAAAVPCEKRLFVFGLGYVGAALAAYLKHVRDDGTLWVIGGTTGSEESKRALEQMGIKPYQFSSSESELSDEIQEALQQSTHLLSTIGPSVNNQNIYHDPVLDAAKRCNVDLENMEWMGYISSTGVYGNRDGAWVDERDLLLSQTKRGKHRIVAETQWADFSIAKNSLLDVFRLGGVYGPGRSVFEALSSKGNSSPSQSRRMRQLHTNRCHVLDVCKALHSAMVAKGSMGGIYNVVDDAPAPRSDVESYAQTLLAKDSTKFQYKKFPATRGKKPRENKIKRHESSIVSNASRVLEEKRVCNGKLKALMGGLEFPTYVEGLTAIWQDVKTKPPQPLIQYVNFDCKSVQQWCEALERVSAFDAFSSNFEEISANGTQRAHGRGGSGNGRQESSNLLGDEIKAQGDHELQQGVPRSTYRYLRLYLVVVNVLVLAHALLMAFTDPFNSSDQVKHILVFSFQVFLLVATLMAFLLLSSRTMFIRVGLYERFFGEFKWIFVAFLLAFSLFTATQGIRLAQVLKKSPHLELWKTRGYIPLFALERLALILYYGLLVGSTFRVLDNKMYTMECLQP